MNKKQKTILVFTTIGALITTFFILNKNKKIITLGKASIIDRVINTGKTLIGTPYVWGGCTPGGFDCSGFIQYIFAQNGIVLPRTTTGLFSTLPDGGTISKGDLLALDGRNDGTTSHVGLYIGNGQMIHAGSTSGVVITNINPYWSNRIKGIYNPF